CAVVVAAGLAVRGFGLVEAPRRRRSRRPCSCLVRGHLLAVRGGLTVRAAHLVHLLLLANLAGGRPGWKLLLTGSRLAPPGRLYVPGRNPTRLLMLLSLQTCALRDDQEPTG